MYVCIYIYILDARVGAKAPTLARNTSQHLDPRAKAPKNRELKPKELDLKPKEFRAKAEGLVPWSWCLDHGPLTFCCLDSGYPDHWLLALGLPDCWDLGSCSSDPRVLALRSLNAGPWPSGLPAAESCHRILAPGLRILAPWPPDLGPLRILAPWPPDPGPLACGSWPPGLRILTPWPPDPGPLASGSWLPDPWILAPGWHRPWHAEIRKNTWSWPWILAPGPPHPPKC